LILFSFLITKTLSIFLPLILFTINILIISLLFPYILKYNNILNIIFNLIQCGQILILLYLMKSNEIFQYICIAIIGVLLFLIFIVRWCGVRYIASMNELYDMENFEGKKKKKKKNYL
jgi:hypothetical protein